MKSSVNAAMNKQKRYERIQSKPSPKYNSSLYLPPNSPLLRLPQSGYSIPSVVAFPVLLFGSAQLKETNPEKSKNLFSQHYQPAFCQVRFTSFAATRFQTMPADTPVLRNPGLSSWHHWNQLHCHETHSSSFGSFKCAISHGLVSPQVPLRQRKDVAMWLHVLYKYLTAVCSRALSL